MDHKFTLVLNVVHTSQLMMRLSQRVFMGAMVSSKSRFAKIVINMSLTYPFTGRAYLFDYCVNVSIGPAEDRPLITGLHSVCDIFCKRCKNMVGWTYAKAYEASQKYKEGKFIIEKINLHLEESDYYNVCLLYTSPSPRDKRQSRMPSSA